MKFQPHAIIAATALLASLSAPRHTWARRDVPSETSKAASFNDTTSPSDADDAEYEARVASNARWLVDKRHGVIYAFSLQDARPLWSNDGVVFRIFPKTNGVSDEITLTDKKFVVSAAENSGRLYFFLDDTAPRASDAESPSVRRDNLLVALNTNAQGRLVWKRRVQDFAPFFSSAPKDLRFINAIALLPNDELLVQVQDEAKTIRFALDAATGEARRLDYPASN